MDYLSWKNIFNESIQFPYSGMRRKETLVFVTTWKELEGYLLSEISQTEKYKCVGYRLYLETETAKLIKTEWNNGY